jgi:hypothetical protein
VKKNLNVRESDNSSYTDVYWSKSLHICTIYSYHIPPQTLWKLFILVNFILKFKNWAQIIYILILICYKINDDFDKSKWSYISKILISNSNISINI